MILLKCICLSLAIIYGFSNVVKAFRKMDIGSGQLLLMTVGIVGFVYLQFWMQIGGCVNIPITCRVNEMKGDYYL